MEPNNNAIQIDTNVKTSIDNNSLLMVGITLTATAMMIFLLIRIINR